MNKKKTLGQVFTPHYLVCDILNVAGYITGNDILKKHIIDNSCGDGAFLCEIVKRYCDAAKSACLSINDIKNDLETYIHGIEIDTNTYEKCLINLSSVAETYSIYDVIWDIQNKSALDVHEYDNKMDYVVGNPPYVRVHNLDSEFERIKQYAFCSGGMVDLYLVFYEIGIHMLSENGHLCYISPSSWFNSLAGRNMRQFIKQSGYLRDIIDLEHFQPFKASTYTAIVHLHKRYEQFFNYGIYPLQNTIEKVSSLNIETCIFRDFILLGSHDSIIMLNDIKCKSYKRRVVVKNGFATLYDNIFISDNFSFDELTIPVIKASTGKWRKAFYPYDSDGKILSYDTIFGYDNIKDYLNEHKEYLLKGENETDKPLWYGYGRTQALKDVLVDKYSINNVIKDISSINFHYVPKGSGVYSGLYILTDVPECTLKKIILSDEFINYIHMLRKYKSGGYYTYNSEDLEQFLNYKLSIMMD